MLSWLQASASATPYDDGLSVFAALDKFEARGVERGLAPEPKVRNTKIRASFTLETAWSQPVLM